MSVLAFGGLGMAAQASTVGVSAVSQHNGGLTATNPGNQADVAGSVSRGLQLSCSGGVPPCAWTTTGLPPGLTATSAGQIAGTPTTAGTYPVTVTATDTRNATSSASFTWYVYGALTASNPGDQTNTVGVAITPIQLHCFGGFPPCFWTFTNLPPGLSRNSVYQIIGTPTTAGIYQVTIIVKDTRNVSSPPATFTWTINAQ
jgi:hypothetical protein